jgi:DNA topoisomerase-1
VRFLAFTLALSLFGNAYAYAPQSPAAAAAKFKRAGAFAKKRNELRKDAKESLTDPKLDKKTAVAAIVTLMDKTNMRVGSEKYAQREEKSVKLPSGRVIKQEPSYGASSLRKDQVKVKGNTVEVTFRGKSHVDWHREVADAKLAKTVKMFLEQKSGDRLFVDDEGHNITERDVRDVFATYGAKVKDLRTVQANELLDKELSKLDRPGSVREAETNIDIAVKNVALQMGHTPAVCRSNYLDPKKLDAYKRSAD